MELKIAVNCHENLLKTIEVGFTLSWLFTLAGVISLQSNLRVLVCISVKEMCWSWHVSSPTLHLSSGSDTNIQQEFATFLSVGWQ
jgi:hypothetical protein